MFIGLIMILTLSLIVVTANPKNEPVRWFIYICLSACIGFLSFVMEEPLFVIFKYLLQDTGSALYYSDYVISVLSSVSFYFGPYFYLGYSIIYNQPSGSTWASVKRKVYLVLIIPVAAMFIFIPNTPRPESFYLILSGWAVPYYVAGIIIHIISIFKTSTSYVRQQRILNAVFIIPIGLFISYASYLSRAFKIEGIYNHSIWLVTIQCCLFLVFILRYGFLGIRLKFEKYRLEESQKVVTSGISLINHAMKNEILKIDLITQNIKSSVQESGVVLNGFDEDVNQIAQSTDYLFEIISRINDQAREIRLQEEPCGLKNLVDEAALLCKPLFETKGIYLKNNIDTDCTILLDKLHFKEVMCNLFKNAVEAMAMNGEIILELLKNGKYVTLTVMDNGMGISRENLKHVFEPFFTTKARNKNFGLGLSFCYNVIEHHGGTMELESEVGKGTRILINFATKKVLKR